AGLMPSLSTLKDLLKSLLSLILQFLLSFRLIEFHTCIRAARATELTAQQYQRLRCSKCVFFFQAEDGIRDATVTGVQTCALPISNPPVAPPPEPNVGVVKASSSVASALSSGTVESDTVSCPVGSVAATARMRCPDPEIGRASCRERG